MLARILSLLLIPLFVLGQSLPHSHLGSGIGTPSDHANRPHVHLGGGHSHHDDGDHHHDHDETGVDDLACSATGFALSLPHQHDSDAVYLASASIAVGRSAAAPSTDAVSVDACLSIESARPHVPMSSPRNVSARRYGGLPIYLLTASLRL
ncbi:hypothetical protein [Rubripirellula amarantea]|uniref:hypothetical protein n=1 Tax=Rubripirellula amarantea TaxID=2527999 RepID=UPI0011B436C7|nr:hypothetical protein [Rubripirellula amarantea]